MRNFIKVTIVLGLLLMGVKAVAQVPYFAATVGPEKVYGYTSLKIRTGIDKIESYNTFQFGIGDLFAIGADLAVNGSSSYYGLLGRFGYKFSPYFNLGLQFTPSFDLSDKFQFSYVTSALYLNGAITHDQKLFWCSNTWYGINQEAKNTIDQWFYGGYVVELSGNQRVTPMLGCLYSWEFNRDIDLALGAYYSLKKINLYLWSNDLFKSHPRIVMGIDFTM